MLKHSAVDFKEIPKNKLTEKECLVALNYGSRYAGTVLGEIPRELITQEMCNKASPIEKTFASRSGYKTIFK